MFIPKEWLDIENDPIDEPTAAQTWALAEQRRHGAKEVEVNPIRSRDINQPRQTIRLWAPVR